MMQAILIHPQDNVAIALQDLKAHSSIKLKNTTIVLKENIKRGHKFALNFIAPGQMIIKYGYPIGISTCDIQEGSHVHNHNVKTNLTSQKNYTYEPHIIKNLPQSDATFLAYERHNGDIGIRNELWIIPTVFCVNHVARELAKYGNQLIEQGQFNNVDACVALTHPYGCSQMGQDEINTQKILANLAHHPNCGAVLILGLGCENNNINVFKSFLDLNDDRLYFLNAQDVEDEFISGYALIDKMLVKAQQYTRSKQALSKLKIGLKCGGSDGLSGISANPLLGRISDLIVGSNGTSVMSEVPEMFGAEQLLMNRAQDLKVFNQCCNLINNFKQYFLNHGQVVSENPSPGNKAGGITTLEDKSLGCVQKGGQAPIVDVLNYGEKIQKAGLNLLNAPGNDGVSTSALASAGCHLILFTTGRGTPFGSIIPTLKIATNSAIFERKHNWLDFNAGALIEDKDMDTLVLELLDLILACASGKKTKAELRGFRELIIWKDGVTM